MIEAFKLLYIAFVCAVTLPVMLFVVLCCVVYEVLRRLWVTWQWLKEIAK